MNKPFFRANDIDTIRKIVSDLIQEQTAEGDVETVANNGAMAQVRVRGSNAIQPAFPLKGLVVAQNDHVIMLRSKSTSRWIIVGGYVVGPNGGSSAAQSSTVSLAPSGLVVTGIVGMLLIRWSVGINTTGIFEVEIANDVAETGAVNFIVSGSVLPYSTTGTKYVRVRALKKMPDGTWNQSGWTAWVSATASATLSVPLGGTGTATLAAHAALIGSGTSPITTLAPGTARNTMISDGTDWASRALVDADIPNALTISGGTVDNTPIGATTQSTVWGTNGRFDDLKVNAASLDASAVAQLDSTAKGFLPPRMTTTQRNAIASPAEGLIIHNTTTFKLNQYQNGAWEEVGTGTGGPGGISSTGSVTKKTILTRTVLYDQTLGSPGNFDVTGISGAYDHLEVIASLRSNSANGYISLQVNGDTTAGDYVYDQLTMNNGVSGNYVSGDTPAGWMGYIPASGSDTGVRGNVNVFIPDYASSRIKLMRSHIEMRDISSRIYSKIVNWLWNSTAAITRLFFLPQSGETFETDSRLQVIGIKEEEVVTDVGLAIPAPGVKARAKQGTGQAFLNTVDKVVNFETVDFDTDSAITTGAAWKFTAPRAAYYRVSANLVMDTASSSTYFVLALNGSTSGAPVLRFTQNTSWDKTLHGTTTIYLAVGDYIQVVVNQSSGGTTNSVNALPDYSYIDIESVDGGPTNTGYILIRDEKAQNTNGGAFTSGAWRTRVLNTLVTDTTGAVSLGSNQITLPAGTYRIRAWAPSYLVNRSQARLRNITDSTTTLLGSSTYQGASDTAVICSVIIGRFTIAGTKVFEIQHQCSATNGTNGFGVEANFDTEVYTVVEIEKES